MLTEAKIMQILEKHQDPVLKKSLVDLGAVRDVRIKDNHVSLKIALYQLNTPEQGLLQQELANLIKAAGAESVGFRWEEYTPQEKEKFGPHPGVPNLLAPDSKTEFIAVTSGKGGVGKSTISVNLAVSLARLGKKVGIIDADIYGFSVPEMMGITDRPKVVDNLIYPVQAHGVQVMSMGFFVHDNSPVIWRGPMLGKMLRSFFSEVYWEDDLEYMILDLPPGTGDVALDVHSMIPQSKEIIVTTPHPTAAFVATRAGTMALKTNHEILGVIENMSYYALPDGSKDFIFGEGGGAKVAEILQTKLLAQIPLGQASREYKEEISHSIYPEDSLIGNMYMDLARKITGETVDEQVKETPTEQTKKRFSFFRR